jgi:glycosyltransferase involved in cell wall biosynthesis
MIAVALFGLIGALWLLLTLGAIGVMRNPEWRLPAGAGTAEIDVVVPARDEERNLGPLLDSLLAQTLAPKRIVVVDDRSTDGTAVVIARHAPRVTRVEGQGPPAGWFGKPAALAAGIAATSAPWLLFVDADVRLGADNLASASAEAARRGWDGISLWGRWQTPSFGARLLQSVIGGFVRGAHPLDRVNDPRRSEAFLNGQYLLIRRDALEKIGGWAAVKDRVLEDVALAKIAKREGVKIGMLLAPERMTVVPYRSLTEAFNGYLKNFVAGAGGTRRALAAALAIFLGSILPWIAAVAYALAHRPVPAAAAAFACAAMVLYRMVTARFFHHPKRDALLHPIANAIFVSLILTAVVRTWRGKTTTWKNREVR